MMGNLNRPNNQLHVLFSSGRHPQSSMVYGTNALITKPAISLAPMITVSLLKSYGYLDTHHGHKVTGGLVTEISEDLKLAMFTWACAVPVVVGMLQIICMTMYTIRNSHKSHQQYSLTA